MEGSQGTTQPGCQAPSAPLGDAGQPVRPEGALRVNVQRLALSTAVLDAQLSGAEGVQGLSVRVQRGDRKGGHTWQVTASMWHSCVLPVRNSP